HQKNYGRALKQLQAFLRAVPKDDARRFGAVEQVARIHLQFRRDPEAATAFLEKVKKTAKLSKENRDDVEQWLATAREWKKMGGLTGTDNADDLFRRGVRYYRRGIADTEGPGDETGAASRYIAASYLVPFVVNYDGDQRIAQALLMLGDIHRRSWKDDQWWTVDFYLKEVIRRFPASPEAKRAYRILDEDIRMRWSGSSGDMTPGYLKTMLKRYKARAYGTDKAKTSSK
ncbi:MAG: hypothetical protein AAFV29_16200, partial [Myxococcota bacterium]